MAEHFEPRHHDPLRDAEWFAAQIDMSVDWVRHNTKSLPHHKVGRLVRFDVHCLDLLRTQTAVVPLDAMMRTARSQAAHRRAERRHQEP
ncbi:hypothetical protein ACTVCO_10130 [Sanguibacter sp. A247]|uniref:hypothetical protein n=1 Tax=unclassified Sanguibacter TaxID=2645534 RepID=UPI003FD7D3B5